MRDVNEMEPKETNGNEDGVLITLEYIISENIRRQKSTPNPQKRWSAHTKSKASKSDLRRYATTKIQFTFLPLCACSLLPLPLPLPLKN